MYRFIRFLLFLLNPEIAHHISMKCLKFACFFGLIRRKNITSKPIMIMGLKFPNRVGLAAGLDKNAEYITPLSKLGFGFIEVGTVTPRSQPGNSKPRSFRLITNPVSLLGIPFTVTKRSKLCPCQFLLLHFILGQWFFNFQLVGSLIGWIAEF